MLIMLIRILGGSAHIIKKNAEALVLASKDTGLEVNADKTKYMIMSRDQNAGGSHIIKTDNSSFERVDEFKYLEQPSFIHSLSSLSYDRSKASSTASSAHSAI